MLIVARIVPHTEPVSYGVAHMRNIAWPLQSVGITCIIVRFECKCPTSNWHFWHEIRAPIIPKIRIQSTVPCTRYIDCRFRRDTRQSRNQPKAVYVAPSLRMTFIISEFAPIIHKLISFDPFHIFNTTNLSEKSHRPFMCSQSHRSHSGINESISSAHRSATTSWINSVGPPLNGVGSKMCTTEMLCNYRKLLQYFE